MEKKHEDWEISETLHALLPLPLSQADLASMTVSAFNLSSLWQSGQGAAGISWDSSPLRWWVKWLLRAEAGKKGKNSTPPALRRRRGGTQQRKAAVDRQYRQGDGLGKLQPPARESYGAAGLARGDDLEVHQPPKPQNHPPPA
ncbi:UNVERIFIED_CONTAM: hypothetical protein K2H54_055883 [Gekko kuhli]